jgi:type I restriction enzyme S subunit
MIADLKSYPKYKESDLPWLGKVPTHWGIRALKRLCSRSALYGANISASNYVETGVRFLRTTDITEDGMLRRGGVFVEENKARDYMLSDGDVLLSRSGTIGRSLRYRPEEHGPCAYAGYLVRFVPAPKTNSDFLFHFTKTPTFADFIRLNAISSTIDNVNGEKFANMPLPLPSVSEQDAIVRFLDWANARLKRALHAKRKVISFLDEQKNGIIHRAVTRGLDPKVPHKTSGIPWLEEIPKHWRIARNMALFSHRVEEGIPGLPILQVSLHSGVTAQANDQFGRRKRLIADHTKYKLVRKGDLAYNTMRMWQGAIGVCPEDGLVSPAYVVIQARQGIEPRFYEFLFRTAVYKQQVNRYSTGIVSDRNRLYWQNFKQMPNLSLPIEEQQAICRYIQDETANLDHAIARLEKEIELLREYRTRLVADVVTGKLDVREAAAKLPDEAAPETAELTEDAELSTEEVE